jgi:hypothetical protein
LRPIEGVLLGGFAAGALDIVYAMVAAQLRGRSPVRTVQAVASGLLGASAFDGGTATLLLGFVLQFVIATGAAAVYYLASRRIGLLRRSVLLPSALFGECVYLFMNFVVLPLSAIPFEPKYPPRVLVEGFFSHTLFVGLPIVLALRRVGRPSERNRAAR